MARPYHRHVTSPRTESSWPPALEGACPECGFDPDAVGRGGLADRLRSRAGRWADALARPDVATRRIAGRWSDLEYARHVRDVLRTVDDDLATMLDEDEPDLPGRDLEADEPRDASDDPAAVAAEVRDAARALAHRLDRVGASGWSRAGRTPGGRRVTVASLAFYATHDVEHHLFDVGAD